MSPLNSLFGGDSYSVMLSLAVGLGPPLSCSRTIASVIMWLIPVFISFTVYGTVGGDALSDSRCREMLGGELPAVVAVVGDEFAVHSSVVWRVGNVFFRGEDDIRLLFCCSLQIQYIILMLL